MSEPKAFEVLRLLNDVVDQLEQFARGRGVLVRALDRETEECAALVESFLAASSRSGARYDIPLAIRVRIAERKGTEAGEVLA